MSAPPVGSHTQRGVLPPHVAQQARRVWRLVRARLGEERLRHLQQDTAEVARAVRRVAKNLHNLADTSYPGSRSAQAAKDLQAVAGRLVQLSEDLGRPFLLFVVGMGKFGKSTLINALLGQRVAAMDALPKTWKIDVFTRTLPDGVAEVRYVDGRVQRMTVSEAAALIAAEERRQEESEELVWRLFQERARLLSSITDKELLRHELEILHLYRSPVVEVKWPVSDGPLTRHFDVVDTPGLWQERPERERPSGAPSNGLSAAPKPFSLVSAEDLRSYYLQADGVLWMLDATKLAAGKPHELINDLNTALSRVGGVARNAVAVLNRIDLVRRNGGEDAVRRVVDQAHRLLGDVFQQVIPVSAREALEAQESGDNERLKRSGLPDLLAVIDERFRVSGADVRLWSKSQGREQRLLEAQAVSLGYRQELTEAELELRKRAADAARHLGTLEKKAQQRLSALLADYQASVNIRIDLNARSVLSKKENERQQYLRDEIYQLDRLRAELNLLLADVRQEYAKTVAALVPHQQFTGFRYVEQPPKPGALAPLPAHQALANVSVYTGDLHLPDDLAVAGGLALLGLATLGPAGLLLGLAAGFVQDLLGSPAVARLQARLRDQLANICSNVQQQWNTAIEGLSREHGQHLQEVRDRTFAQVHVPPARLREALRFLGDVKADPPRPAPLPALTELLFVPWVHAESSQRMPS